MYLSPLMPQVPHLLFRAYSAAAARFEESPLNSYVDEHKFCGLHPLGRKAFTMQAFGHLGRERYVRLSLTMVAL